MSVGIGWWGPYKIKLFSWASMGVWDIGALHAGHCLDRML